MKPHRRVSRRHFLAASSSLLIASQLPGAEEKSETKSASKLAVQGGEKAVKVRVPKVARWGDLERDRLNTMLGQDSLFYWNGPQTAAFIERFKKFCPLEHVMTCSSGTAAIHIAVAAAGIGPGDEVITAPITDIGSTIGVLYQQAVPVFADLGANTYNLDVADVERRITPKTKAIIAVHLGGNPCDTQALRKLADRRGLILIEDCAQAWAAKYRGQPIGTTGHIACFSLQNTKLITCGDGGAVASSDNRIGPLLQRFGDKGFDRLTTTGLFENFSTNYRMSEPQAAVAAAQLERLEKIAARRSELGNRLTEKIRGTPGISAHEVHVDDRCVYWFYMMRIRPEAFRANRAELVKALAAEGAPVAAGYIPVPLFRNPVFLKHGFFAGRWPIKEFGLTAMDYTKVSCPEAESILTTGIRITIHEAMSDEFIDDVATAIRKVAAHFAV
jgi:dTDP-4-amino-4,6-dideoxygalactose transaminase